MNASTVHSKVLSSIQKCRRAIRLYDSIIKRDYNAKLSNLQSIEWKKTNEAFLEALYQIAQIDVRPKVSTVLPHSKLNSFKNFTDELTQLMEEFYSQWRITQSILKSRQIELIAYVENSEFIKSSIISTELISLKAKMESSKAVFEEIYSILKVYSNVRFDLLFEKYEDKSQTDSSIDQNKKVLHIKR